MNAKSSSHSQLPREWRRALHWCSYATSNRLELHSDCNCFPSCSSAAQSQRTVFTSMTPRMEVTIPMWLWKSSEMWLLSAFYPRLVKVANFKKVIFLTMQDTDFLLCYRVGLCQWWERINKIPLVLVSLKRKALSVDCNFAACLMLVPTVTCRAVKITFKQEYLLWKWFSRLHEAMRSNCMCC